MSKKNGFYAAALVALVSVASIVPASAQIYARSNNADRDRVITTYCDRNPGDPDCNRFRNGGWNNNDYNSFYRSRRSGLDSIASGIFGFTFGAIVGGALSNQNNGRPIYVQPSQPRYGYQGNYQAHVNACFNRYRSYDEESNTYMGYDGVRRQCAL